MPSKYILRLSLTAFLLANVSFIAAQPSENAYVYYDTYGKIVYHVPEVIARKTMDVAFSAPSTFYPPNIAAREIYAIQVGTFAVKENADRLRQQLERDGYRVEIKDYLSQRKNHFYVVFAGQFESATEAKAGLRAIKNGYSLDGLLRSKSLRKG